MEQWTVSSLMSLLPRGLAVGPSLSCGGALGLWWVGLPLEAGTELPRGLGVHWGSTNHEEATAAERSTAPLFLGFARQAQSGSRHNLSVQTQGQTVRATRTIQTGAELLLGPAAEPDGCSEESHEQTADTEEMTADETNRDGSKTKDDEGGKTTKKYAHSKTRYNKMSDPELSTGLDSLRGEERGAAAPPAVRCSVRMASKPRLVHSLSSRRTMPPVPKPAASARKRVKPEQGRGRGAEQVGGAVTADTTGDGHLKVREASGDAVTLETNSDVFTVETAGGRARRHTCEMCGKRFFQKSHLDKHRFTHSNEKPFTCDKCDKSYSSKESYKAHQLLHQGQRPFPCPLCPKAYGLKRDLKEHLVLHSGQRPFTCPDCGRGFTRRPSLRVHRLIHCERRDSTAKSPMVQCSVCSKFLSNSGSLMNHMKVHTGERPHVCQHCDKRFSQRGNLVAHMRAHSGEQPFTCTDCGQSFSQWKELQRHQQAHSGIAFLCSSCGKVLKDAHTLRAHEALHSEARPHPCPHCPKGYVSSSKLRRHLRCAHSTEKPFTCACGAAYALRQSLKRHQALHRPCGAEEGAGPQDQQRPITGRPQTDHEGAQSDETEVTVQEVVVELDFT